MVAVQPCTRQSCLPPPRLALATPALANDSEAAIHLGGIELVANKSISMDSEDLYISQDEIRVKYRYTNQSAKDLELTISFPLPPVKAKDAEQYEMEGTPDFTQRLQQLGWPIDWINGNGDQPGFVRKLTPAKKAAHVAEGLLRKTESGEFFPTWDVATHVTRKQLFPAGMTVIVTHRYAPMTGGSVAGSLFPEVRKTYNGLVTQYCIDKAFLSAFDKKAAERIKDPDAPMAYSEPGSAISSRQAATGAGRSRISGWWSTRASPKTWSASA